MKNLKALLFFVLLVAFMFSLGSCTTTYYPNSRVRHDNGLHKGWYKHPNNPHHPYSHKKYKKNKKGDDKVIIIIKDKD